MLTGPHFPQSPTEVSPERGSALIAPLPQETVVSQDPSPMGGRTMDQRCRGKDKRLLGYGISSTAAPTRGEEMRVKLHSLGRLMEATKRSREKAPITHQLTALKTEKSTTESLTQSTANPPISPAPHHTAQRATAAQLKP